MAGEPKSTVPSDFETMCNTWDLTLELGVQPRMTGVELTGIGTVSFTVVADEETRMIAMVDVAASTFNKEIQKKLDIVAESVPPGVVLPLVLYFMKETQQVSLRILLTRREEEK